MGYGASRSTCQSGKTTEIVACVAVRRFLGYSRLIAWQTRNECFILQWNKNSHVCVYVALGAHWVKDGVRQRERESS